MASMIQKDPTRTAMIRRKFLAEMKQRFGKLKSAIWQLVAVEDCFGLRRTPSPLEALLNNNRFAFDSDAEKIKKFRIWLQEQVAAGILTVPPGGDPQQAWMSKYLFLAYRQGVTQAYAIGRPDSSTPSDLDSLTQSVFLDSMFNGPIGTRQLELLATRAFEELDGITKGMSGDMARILSDGFVRGDNPAKIARELVKGVEGIERKRALMLARTELIHAHAEGSLDSLEALGFDEVTAMVEWTAEDDACELCSDLVGVTLTIAEARGLLPRHPNCRCAWLPAPFKEPGQKRGRRAQIAIDRSLRAEGRKGDSLKEARARSKWAGADLRIAATKEQKARKRKALKAARRKKTRSVR